MIELLIVIAIIGLLASILVASLNTAESKARDAYRLAEFHEISTALAVYDASHGSYPPLLNNIPWNGYTCDSGNNPSCLSTSDANWNSMISALQADGDIRLAAQRLSWQDKLASIIAPVAFASTNLLQDPQYPTRRFAYMTDATFQNYRLRVQLENLNNSTLQTGLQGKFYWTDKSYPNACYDTRCDDTCDPSTGYFCDGPSDTFNSFNPGKPVIYLYPLAKTDVEVRIEPKAIDSSIPAYGNGWVVTAYPDGDLVNHADNEAYPYLFWEGQSDAPIVNRSEGAVVRVADISSFLSESLAAQGLNQKEISDFEQYWVPRMTTAHPYVYVYFMPKSDYDKLVPMQVTPTPQTVIRVYMLFKTLDAPISVTPQTFTAPKRVGFTVVEWGGDRSQL